MINDPQRPDNPAEETDPGHVQPGKGDKASEEELVEEFEEESFPASDPPANY